MQKQLSTNTTEEASKNLAFIHKRSTLISTSCTTSEYPCMNATFFSRIVVIFFFTLAITPLHSPRRWSYIESQRAHCNELLKKTIDPKTIATLTLNGEQFIPPFLIDAVGDYIKNPNAYFGTRKLRALIKNVKRFFKNQKHRLGYNVYLLNNKKAPTIFFEGEKIPESLQFGQALCISLIMIDLLICTSCLHDKAVGKTLTNLQKIINQETTKYNFNNPDKPHFVDATRNIVLGYIGIGQHYIFNDYASSSTDASSGEEEDSESKPFSS